MGRHSYGSSSAVTETLEDARRLTHSGHVDHMSLSLVSARAGGRDRGTWSTRRSATAFALNGVLTGFLLALTTPDPARIPARRAARVDPVMALRAESLNRRLHGHTLRITLGVIALRDE